MSERNDLRTDLAVALSALAPAEDQESEVWRCVDALIRAAKREAALRAIEACKEAITKAWDSNEVELDYETDARHIYPAREDAVWANVNALRTDPAIVPGEE